MIPIGDSTRLKKPSIITPLLIASCILVYLYMLVRGPSFAFYIAKWGVIPFRIQQSFTVLPTVSPVFLTIITSIFVHGGIWHLISNMLFLWVFGDNIEDRLGKIWFLFFYLLGGIIAFLLQYYVNPGSKTPMVGASGAISAVMGAYIYLYPSATVATVIPVYFFPLIINVPAMIFLLFWFGTQVVNVWLGTPGVGWLAHIGGFLFGLLFAMVFIPRKK